LLLVSTISLANLPKKSAHPLIKINTNNAYALSLLPEVQRIQSKFNIPPQITIAIAIHETDNGRAVIGGNNHWGLKHVVGSPSQTRTTEFYNGNKVSLIDGFQTCPEINLCGDIFGRTFTNLLGETNLTLLTTDPDRAIHIVGQKYATDPKWAEQVIKHKAQL